MKLLAWNLRQGGGRKRGVAVGVIAGLAPDVAVITEFRSAPSGGPLADHFAASRYPYVLDSAPAKGRNGVLIASRTPLRRRPIEPPVLAPTYCLCADAPELGITIGGVYVPGNHTGIKREFWTWLLGAAKVLVDGPAVLLGDFNTGRHYIDESRNTFACADLFEELLAAGWKDAFRELHPDRSTLLRGLLLLRSGLLHEPAEVRSLDRPVPKAVHRVADVRREGFGEHRSVVRPPIRHPGSCEIEDHDAVQALPFGLVDGSIAVLRMEVLEVREELVHHHPILQGLRASGASGSIGACLS